MLLLLLKGFLRAAAVCGHQSQHLSCDHHHQPSCQHLSQHLSVAALRTSCWVLLLRRLLPLPLPVVLPSLQQQASQGTAHQEQ